MKIIMFRVISHFVFSPCMLRPSMIQTLVFCIQVYNCKCEMSVIFLLLLKIKRLVRSIWSTKGDNMEKLRSQLKIKKDFLPCL